MTKTKGGVLTAAPLTVTIGDERFDLIPNLRAVKALTPVFDGLLPAFTRVRNIDPDTTVAVVLAASGVTKSAEEIEALTEAVWSGPNRVEIRTAVVNYLGQLLNGGHAIGSEPAVSETAGNADA